MGFKKVDYFKILAIVSSICGNLSNNYFNWPTSFELKDDEEGEIIGAYTLKVVGFESSFSKFPIIALNPAISLS